ncbi:MAG: DUF1549 and DUF1553 domain-containing protein [Pirellulaceae bacterium]
MSILTMDNPMPNGRRAHRGVRRIITTNAADVCCAAKSGLLLALLLLSCLASQNAPVCASEPSDVDNATPNPVPLKKESAKWVGLTVYPESIQLKGTADYQTVVAVAERSDGITRDVTEEVNWDVKPAEGSAGTDFASFDDFRLTPTSDGQGELEATWKGLTAVSQIEVQDASTSKPTSFHLDIMPVLTRTGCNTGSCHGAARGKDGFRLSLFGFDPAGDHQRITREIGIRRINLAIPDQSLVYLKAIGGVPHSGGKRMEPDSVYAKTLLNWLEGGAKTDNETPPTCTKVDLFPTQAVLEGEGAKQRMVAVAHYSDGTTRDITNLAAFTTNNERSAAVDDQGAITTGVRGEAFVMARFDTHTVGSQILALPNGLEYEAPSVSGNYIDELVAAKLQRLRVVPSGLCTDEEFLRRVTIDIAGQLPTEEEFAEFIDDPSPNKRSVLIDRLLERKEFSEIWAMKWAQLLLVKSNNQVSYKAAFLYSSWLTNKLAEGTPIDQIVRELIGSNGGVFEQPATNFYQVERDTLKTAENVAQVFMGIRTQCAQCHNHPFDRWTMDDYYGFASFFSQIGRKTGEDYREIIVYNRGGGEVAHPVTKKPVPPTFLGGSKAETKGKDRRAVLADWMTSPDNPFFAKSVANRVWAHFMGVGIVDPVDDIRVSNPASNPALFEELGARLTSYEFDLKSLVRDICNSAAYQRSTQTNESNRLDNRNYAYAQVRRVPAEMLLDCVSQATNTKDKFRGLPQGARAVQIADGRTSTYFLNTFGRSPRTTVCDCEASTDPSLSQALHLLNGASTQGKVAQGKLISTWLEQNATVPEAITRIYIRCLSRMPTEGELQNLTKLVSEAGNNQVGLEDAFWAVLNSREFLFNH